MPSNHTPFIAALLALALAGNSAWSATDSPKTKTKPGSKAAAAQKTPVAEPEDNTPLNEEQIAVGPQVLAGDANCEFKNRVSITPDAENPGRFKVQFGKMIFNMAPEPTTTGAVRLEDKKAGVVWLQIPTKSMLMNTKAGQRMVDFCMHSAQISEAQSAALAGAQNESSTQAAGSIGITPQATSKQ